MRLAPATLAILVATSAGPAMATAEPPPPAPKAITPCGTIDLNRVSAEQGHAFVLPYFAADGDSGGASTRSPVQLFEGSMSLGPAHIVHDSIRTVGAGRYSHWGRSLYFSSSDNTDPRLNGRSYSWGVATGGCPQQICGPIDVSQARPNGGSGYFLTENFGFPGDSGGAATRSSLRLYEGSTPLGPAHSVHDDIRTVGRGRFSHWGNALFFSASDNTDPRANGRSYFYGGSCRALADVRLTRLASRAPFFATFASHNQRVVETRDGLFVVHLTAMYPGSKWRDGSPLDTKVDWQLLRSTDGGATLARLYAGNRQGAHVSPILESDAAGNLYVFEQQFTTLTGGDVGLLKFSPTLGFTSPTRSVIPGMASDKFSAVYDSALDVFYYGSTGYGPGHPARIATVRATGGVQVSPPLVVEGSHGFLMYPLLALDDRGMLYLAWTSQALPRITRYLYWDIHFMQSPDRGATWTTAAGAPLVLPVPADSDGRADRVTLGPETGTHPWLSGFLPWRGMLHFSYETHGTPPGKHYKRFNTATGRMDVTRFPVFEGNTLRAGGMGGFFTLGREGKKQLLYFVGASPDGAGVVILASDDAGATWFDYATSRARFHSIYSESGPRRIGPSGNIYGVFTDLETNDEALNSNDVWLFTVKGE
jgi:hypothetical protein